MLHHTTPAIHAARAVVRGDVSRARAELVGCVPAFRVYELRALQGACREANRRYGCEIDWRELVGWRTAA